VGGCELTRFTDDPFRPGTADSFFGSDYVNSAKAHIKLAKAHVKLRKADPLFGFLHVNSAKAHVKLAKADLLCALQTSS
jgi:hypothetical protein